ncbi:MAG TPA: hypothetical protein VNM48_14975 [Chloroflexota bacterium]|nr:hypothetical protein [Chloroflexota bacterium]
MPPTYLPVGYFRDSGTVYTENATTGRFTVVAQAGLACRVNDVSRQAAATGQDRADLASIRELHSDPAFSFPPADHQIAIDGRTWNPNRRTRSLEKHHDGTGIYWRTDLTEAGS